jgi:uncharacterized protein YdiU (UPF0061 family)
VRIGTFEYFANRDDTDGVRALADYVIARHYPEAAGSEQPYRAFLEGVIGRVAALVARWQLVGFIHGVMNTDNMSIAGETIDYGPCAFLDSFHPGTVYSSIDTQGRYAYGNQPRIAYWNLSRLAGALLPLLAPEEDAGIAIAQTVLDSFPARFEAAYLDGLRRKLGLLEVREGDGALARDLLERMAGNQADFTLTFRGLAEAAAGNDELVRNLFADPTAFDAWALEWRQRLAQEDGPAETRQAVMRGANPAFIPRNHRVQAVLTAAEAGDFAPLDALMTVLATPSEDPPGAALSRAPPRPDEVVRQTFCGT